MGSSLRRPGCPPSRSFVMHGPPQPWGAEELDFCTETFPASSSFALRGRGKHRLGDKPPAARHTPPRLLHAQPGSHSQRQRLQTRPGPPGSCGGCGCSHPRAAGAALAGCRSESLGKGGRVPPARIAAPHTPRPSVGLRGGWYWYPSLEPRVSARPRSAQLGQWDTLALLLHQWHCVDEKNERDRARVLANIYSEIHNCFAFAFCHLVTI